MEKVVKVLPGEGHGGADGEICIELKAEGPGHYVTQSCVDGTMKYTAQAVDDWVRLLMTLERGTKFICLEKSKGSASVVDPDPYWIRIQ